MNLVLGPGAEGKVTSGEQRVGSGKGHNMNSDVMVQAPVDASVGGKWQADTPFI